MELTVNVIYEEF